MLLSQYFYTSSKNPATMIFLVNPKKKFGESKRIYVYNNIA